jgi:hypothetical protein
MMDCQVSQQGSTTTSQASLCKYPEDMGQQAGNTDPPTRCPSEFLRFVPCRWGAELPSC